MAARELPWGKLAAAGVLVVLVAGLATIVRGGQSVPDTVQAIEWNRQPCAHCQMLIGDPRYAAQLITTDGDIVSFDDPGCALRYVAGHHPHIHRLWFHHSVDERWLPAEQAAFTTGATTPMGSGLAAVDARSPGAIDLPEATRHAMREESPR
jgi:copper chaperone NosL